MAGGSNGRFTLNLPILSSLAVSLLCFTEGLFVLHTKDLIREETPTLKLFPLPFLLKGTKKEETAYNFNFTHFQSQKITFALRYVGTYSLAGWCLPIFHFGPLLGGGGGTSTTSGDGGGTSTTSGDDCLASSSLQKQEAIS